MKTRTLAFVSFARPLALLAVTLLLATGAVVGVRPPPAGAASPEVAAAAQSAADWLKTKQQSDGGFEVAGFPGFETPDAVLAVAEEAQSGSTWSQAEALAAVSGLQYGGSGPTPLDALDALAEDAVADALTGTAAKLIVLDVAPLGLDPGDFDPSGDSPSAVDLSATLDPGGCSADKSSFGFFGQTLYGVLAKRLVCGSTPPAAVAAVRAAQQQNGGWNFLADPNGTGVDIDTTSLAIQALIASGADSSDSAVAAGLGLIASAQNTDGSWDSPYTQGDPNSTAMAIMAVAAAGFDVSTSCWRDKFAPERAGDPYTSPDDWLVDGQDPDGHIQSPNDVWGVNTFATSQALEALLRGWLPVSRASGEGCGRRAILAEGAAAGGFETWVSLANPDATGTATARLTFLTGEGPVTGPEVSIPPQSRRSVRVGEYVTTFDVSTLVESPGLPVIAERSVYSSQPGRLGAHLGKEVRQPVGSWFLAEGVTAGGLETWVLVANPSETDTASVALTYLTGSGPVAGPLFALGPQSRRSVRVDDTVPSDYNVSTKVVSTGAAVVAERSTYMAGSESFAGATSSPGSPLARDEWFLAEGATAGGFETWVLVANPSDSETASVALTYLTSFGAVTGPAFALAPGSRHSVRVDDTVPADYNVSTRVSSTGAGVVAERALYSDHPVLGKTSSTGEGTGAAFDGWLLPEGATGGGFETWVLVANPSMTETASVALTYLTGSGPVSGPSFTVGPASRRSVRIDDTVPSDYNVSTRVASTGAGVVAEHSVYAPPAMSGDATGGPGLPLW